MSTVQITLIVTGVLGGLLAGVILADKWPPLVQRFPILSKYSWHLLGVSIFLVVIGSIAALQTNTLLPISVTPTAITQTVLESPTPSASVTLQVASSPQPIPSTFAPTKTNTLTPPTALPTPTPAIITITTQKRGNDNAEMVHVPKGAFTMGSTEKEVNDALRIFRDRCTNCDPGNILSEAPPHSVYLNAFWIDKYEVTNALYKYCVDAKICDEPKETSSNKRGWYFGNPQFDDFPVIYVSWDNAVAYCNWAGKRLPTEAEWEKAARGTDRRNYPWGNEFDSSRLNSDQVIGDTTGVREYENGASPYGALNMAGNVWEWVRDSYDPNDPYYEKSPPNNPVNTSEGNYRVIRGGSWYLIDDYTRSAFRGDNVHDFRAFDFGFRCAQ